MGRKKKPAAAVRDRGGAALSGENPPTAMVQRRDIVVACGSLVAAASYQSAPTVYLIAVAIAENVMSFLLALACLVGFAVMMYVFFLRTARAVVSELSVRSSPPASVATRTDSSSTVSSSLNVHVSPTTINSRVSDEGRPQKTTMSAQEKHLRREEKRHHCVCENYRPRVAGPNTPNFRLITCLFEHCFALGFDRDPFFESRILDLATVRPNCIHCNKTPAQLHRIMALKEGDAEGNVFLFVKRKGTCGCARPMNRFTRPPSMRAAEGTIRLLDLIFTDVEDPILAAEKAYSFLFSNECLFCCRNIETLVDENYDDDAADNLFDDGHVFLYTGDERTDERFAMVASMGIEPSIGYFAARGVAE